MRKSSTKWAEDNIRVDGEAFARANWRLMCEMLDELDTRLGCRFLVGGSIQSWKSFLAQVHCLASFHLRPARTLWYSANKDVVQEFAEEKLNPLYESIRRNKWIEPEDRNRIKTLAKQFPHMPFVMLSAHTKSSRQSKTAARIYSDEAWMYEPGELTEIEGRLTAYMRAGSWQHIIPSSGWDEGSELSLIWRKSDQRLAHVICPACCAAFYPDCYAPDPVGEVDPVSGKTVSRQPPGGLLYRTDESVRDGSGLIHARLFAASVRYQCPHCSAPLSELPLDTLHFVAENPSAARDTVAWKWNALCHLPMHMVALQKAEAEEALARGDPKPIEDFDRKRALREWSPSRLYVEAAESGNYGDYAWAEPWAAGIVKTMTIDVQQGFYWWLVRAWGGGAQSRLLACGRAYNDAQLRELQLRYGVADHGGEISVHPKTGSYYLPRGCGVAIDGNYDTARVRRLAATYHWIVLRGKDQSSRFLHRDGKRRIYNEIQAIESLSGVSSDVAATYRSDKYVAEIDYSAYDAREVLRTLKGVSAPAQIHTYPRDIAEHCPEYLEHQKSWRYHLSRKGAYTEQQVGRWVQVKAHDDLEWCERASVVLAATFGLIGAAAAPEARNGDSDNQHQTLNTI